MFYNNFLKKKKIKYVSYNYLPINDKINSDIDDNFYKLNYICNSYNFNYNDGTLKNGIGICPIVMGCSIEDRSLKKILYTPADNYCIKKAWLYTYWSTHNTYIDSIIAYDSNNELCFNFLYEPSCKVLFNNIKYVKYNKPPNVINYNLNGEDVVIMTGDAGVYIWNCTEPATHVVGIPSISSMCIFYNRLFLTIDGDRRSIWFSDDLDPTNFTQSLNNGGYIKMIDERGPLNKLIVFNDSLYVFHEYGISKISAYGNKNEFSVSQLFVSSTQIYPNSITLCGDIILFLSSDGLYSFNGIDTKKIDINIDKMFGDIVNDKSISAYHRGNYYLACKLNFMDNVKIGCENSNYSNNALIKINVTSSDFSIMRGYDIVELSDIKDEVGEYLLCCYKENNIFKDGMIDDSGQVKGSATIKYWKSQISSFNEPTKNKIIKEFSIYTKEDIIVNFIVDNKGKEYIIKGKNLVQKIRPNLIGKQIGIEIKSSTFSPVIKEPRIVVGIL